MLREDIMCPDWSTLPAGATAIVFCIDDNGEVWAQLDRSDLEAEWGHLHCAPSLLQRIY